MKLTKVALKLLKQNIEIELTMASIIIRMRGNCKYLTSGYTEKPISFYEGVRQANEQQISSTLNAYKQYKGYNERTVINDLRQEVSINLYHGKEMISLFLEVLEEINYKSSWQPKDIKAITSE